MKKNKRLLVMIIALIMLFPSNVYAVPADTAPPTVASTASAAPDSSQPNVSEPVVRVQEEVGLRTANSDTYRMSDGSFECVVYAEDKYYPNEQDELVPIDNSLVAAEKGTAYENAANVFSSAFSAQGKPTVDLSYQNHSISFAPLFADSAGKSQTVQNSNISVGAVRNCAALSKLTATGSNTATYANAFPNTDLVYIVENSGIKEYIILRDKNCANTFRFRLQLEGLTPQITEGNPTFVDADGNVVFALTDLFAVDSGNGATDKLAYSLQSGTGRNEFILTVTLDSAFLSDPARVFPVVIDPTIMISSLYTADAYVCSNYPTTNYYSSTYLRTGKDTPFGVRRSYIKFDLPTFPTNFTINTASLDIQLESGSVPNLYAFRCRGTWDSSTITWNNKPNYHETGMSNKALSRGNNWYSMMVTLIVRAWLIDLQPNYGFMIMDSLETDTNHWTTYYSSEAVSPHKPELHINYTLPDYVFTNYYDSSFISAYAWRIPDAVNAVNKAYSDCFGITFGATGNATYRSNLTDRCTLGANTRCSSACSPHHKDVYSIANTLYAESRANNEITVFWTDREKYTYCSHETGSCQLYEDTARTVNAVVFSHRPVIHILNIVSDSGTYSEYEACMAILLIHETAHTFGMNDCYDIPSHAERGYQCVMEQYMDNAGNNLFAENYYAQIKANGQNAFCSTCRNTLDTLIP